MCVVDKIAACEISFLPLESRNCGADVERAIDVIKESGLQYSVGFMSTLVRGERDRIFTLLKEIYISMDDICSFTMIVKVSNLCGCE